LKQTKELLFISIRISLGIKFFLRKVVVLPFAVKKLQKNNYLTFLFQLIYNT